MHDGVTCDAVCACAKPPPASARSAKTERFHHYVGNAIENQSALSALSHQRTTWVRPSVVQSISFSQSPPHTRTSLRSRLCLKTTPRACVVFCFASYELKSQASSFSSICLLYRQAAIKLSRAMYIEWHRKTLNTHTPNRNMHVQPATCLFQIYCKLRTTGRCVH